MKTSRESPKKLKIVGLFAAALVLLYIASYLAFRVTHTQVWANDGHPYVIFPSGSVVIWYLFRPVTQIDGAMTGMRFHIGPHR